MLAQSASTASSISCLSRGGSVDTPAATRPIGFMDGEIAVPDDFDSMGRGEIERLFATGK